MCFLMIKTPYVAFDPHGSPGIAGDTWWYAHTQPMLKLLIILGWRNGRMADEIQKKT